MRRRWMLATLLLLPLQAKREPFWNQFRGPNGSGVMKTAEVPAEFGPDRNVVWKRPIGEGQSSPVIQGDRIFLSSCSGDDKSELTTICLDRAKGDVLWRKTVRASRAAHYFPRLNGPASPTPAADAKHVYVYFGTFGLICYRHDGTKVWERRIDPPDNQYGMSTSPILYGGEVILVLDDNRGRSRVIAVARDSGETAWEKARPLCKAGWSTPMIWRHARGDELVVLGSRRLDSYDPKTGEELWWADGFSMEPIGVPVSGGGLLFVSDAARAGRGETEMDAAWSWKVSLRDFDGNGDKRLQRSELARGFRIPLRPELARNEPGAAYRIGAEQIDGWFKQLDRDRDGVVSEQDWKQAIAALTKESQPTLLAVRPGARGNARPEHVAWKIHTGIPEVPSPLYYGGRVWLLRKGGRLLAVDAETGEQVFRENLGARGQYLASPIAAGDRIITASERGVVTVLAAAGKFRVLARNDFRERILATPAVAGKRLYVRTVRHLYAIGENAR